VIPRVGILGESGHRLEIRVESSLYFIARRKGALALMICAFEGGFGSVNTKFRRPKGHSFDSGHGSASFLKLTKGYLATFIENNFP